MPTKVKAVQIGVTFGRDDLDLLATLQDVSERSGVPVSHLIRQSVRASLLEDDEALASLEPLRSFSAARLLARAAEGDVAAS